MIKLVFIDSDRCQQVYEVHRHCQPGQNSFHYYEGIKQAYAGGSRQVRKFLIPYL
jgi:hypothetical protein